MNPPDFAQVGPRSGFRYRLIVGLICLALLALLGLQLVTSTPAAAASAPTQSCPPDCGKVAAGDPLLVPYMTVNPGLGWLALPAAGVQSSVNELKQILGPETKHGVLANVAAARWTWLNNQFNLQIVLVSSTSLDAVHLGASAQNAGDICASSNGKPGSQLIPIPGIPGSMTGLCVLPSGGVFKGATVVAFKKGNVAVLMEIRSTTDKPVGQATATTAAQQQFETLPANGVLVSNNGLDIGLVIVWILMLSAIAYCIVACARRGKSWKAPFELVASAFDRRKVALAISLVAVVGAMGFSMLDFSLLHGIGEWYEAGFNDFWRAWSSSADMTYSGGYGQIYILNSALETAPAFLALIAPISRLGFGLSFPYPSAVLYPTAFWLAGPFFLGAMALPICAGDRWMAHMGVVDIRRRVAVLGTMAITLPVIALFGHSEDLLALGAMLYGLIAAFEGRNRAAGWWLGVALAFQFLAILAIPIALLLLKRKQWTAAIIPMIIVPLSFMIVPLISEPHATLRQLIHQQVYFDMGFISPTWYLDPGVAAFIRAIVALAAIPVAFVLVRLLPEDRKSAANLVIWILALLFALRVAEPELLPYFLAPTMALVPISASRRSWWRLASACALAVWLNWWLHVAVDGRWWAWLFLIAQIGALSWLGFPAGAPETQADVRTTKTVTSKKPTASKRPPPRRPQSKPRVA